MASGRRRCRGGRGSTSGRAWVARRAARRAGRRRRGRQRREALRQLYNRALRQGLGPKLRGGG
eukprot:6514753-Prymnesium_polylepis.2